MCITMAVNKRISLLTLLGLILPLGNIWGPYLIKIPQKTQYYKFRRNLVFFEFFLTLVSFIFAIAFNLKGVTSGFNPNFIRISAYILTFQYIAIIVTAFIAPMMVYKSKI